MEWYYILGIISYGIFIIQFILSSLVGWIDVDFDVDLDGAADFSFSDLISFKGLLHFLMGFSGWLMLIGEVTPFSIAIAIALGLIFVVLLYHIYRICLKFNCEPTVKSGKDLIGKQVIINFQTSRSRYTANCITDSGYIPLDECEFSGFPLKSGDILRIYNYISGVYYIKRISE